MSDQTEWERISEQGTQVRQEGIDAAYSDFEEALEKGHTPNSYHQGAWINIWQCGYADEWERLQEEDTT